MSDLAQTLARWRDEGEAVAMATVIRVDGSAPRGEGAKMLIARSGRIFGSVSGGCVESAVAQEAQRVLDTGEPVTVRYGINKNMMWDVGLACGGAIDVYIESLQSGRAPVLEPPDVACTVVSTGAGGGTRLRAFSHDGSWRLDGTLGDASLDERLLADAAQASSEGAPVLRTIGDLEVFVDPQMAEPSLLIVGAVHIAIALCAFATRAGFAVTVIDPRERLNSAERFPSARERIVDWPEDALPKLTIDDHTYVAVLTHDDKFDDPTLDHVLRRSPRYVGAIGSRKTQALRRERLRAAGFDDRTLDTLHAPIGLDIGAQSPEEIAIAVLAEIIAAKYRHSGAPLKDRNAAHIHSR